MFKRICNSLYTPLDVLDNLQVFGTPRILNIPDASFSNGKGSFSAQLAFPKGQQFVATMSDAGGFGTGGTSDILKVGDSTGNQSCNTTDPGAFALTPPFLRELFCVLTSSLATARG